MTLLPRDAFMEPLQMPEATTLAYHNSVFRAALTAVLECESAPSLPASVGSSCSLDTK